MSKSENPKIALLCIPYLEKFRVFEFTEYTEQYALIPKNVMFQTVKDNVRQIISTEKERLVKLKLEDAREASKEYDVYYIPVAIHQS